MRKTKQSTASRVKRRARATGKRGERPVVDTVPKVLGFPDTYVTTLVYYQQIAIAPSAVIGQYTFRGNSLFDPDYTGTGHQPRYFDQLSAVYGKYRVYGSRVTIEFLGSNGGPVTVCIAPNTNIITATTPQLAGELPRARQRTVGVNGVIAGSLAHKAGTREICGLAPAAIYDEDYSATVGANPLQIWYWNIVAYTFAGGLDVAMDANVRIDYHCEFFDRIDVGLSRIPYPEEVPKEQRKLLLGAEAPPPKKAEKRGVDNNAAPRNPWSREVSQDRAVTRG